MGAATSTSRNSRRGVSERREPKKHPRVHDFAYFDVVPELARVRIMSHLQDGDTAQAALNGFVNT